MSDRSEHTEVHISGAPACPGIVIGKTSLYKRERPTVSNASLNEDQVQNHFQKFDEALSKAKEELQTLSENAHDEATDTLIKTQLAILNDPDLYDRVKQEISSKNKPADAAVESVFESYLQVIKENHGNAYLNKSVDISDIRDRLLQILHNKTDDIAEGTILVARELSPREIISFSNQNIKGILTDRGGATSHAAIIARAMNIPTVVGLKKVTNLITSNEKVVLDGQNGEVILHPRKETCDKYKGLIQQQSKKKANFENICKKPSKTTDGKQFVLQANIEFAEELSIAQKYQAKGVGLLRTESIYLNKKDFENIDSQVAFYSSILEVTKPHSVTIRLFDVGGDKFFEHDKKEQNPFLGWRGIRMLLDQPKLLKNQLKAILKTAGKYKDRVQLLVPMVSTIEEVKQVQALMTEVQEQLTNEGVSVDPNVPLGLMVEVPSVALQADAFAKYADFLSIGTNDLTQYVLAVDRGNERISALYDQRHPAIWRLIKKAVEGARKQDIPISICGELASDPIAAACLMGLGINTLSMNAVVLPSVKQMLRSRSYTDMQQLAQQILKRETVGEVSELFANWEKEGE